MDLGIEKFRDCELLSEVSTNRIAPNPQLFDFLQVHQTDLTAIFKNTASYY